MLRLPTILTTLIALGGLAASTQTFRTDSGKDTSSKSPDPGTTTQPGQSGQYSSPLDSPPSNSSPSNSQASDGSTGNQYFTVVTEWVRRHIESLRFERMREEERKLREQKLASAAPNQDSFHREDPFRR